VTVVADTMSQLGYPSNLAQGLGALILVCTLLFAISAYGAGSA
jgi:hypothetical protein